MTDKVASSLVAEVHSFRRANSLRAPRGQRLPRLIDQPIDDAFIVLTAPLASDAIGRVRRIIAESADHDGIDALHSTLGQLRAVWWAFEPLLGEKEARFVRKRFKRLADLCVKHLEFEAAYCLLADARDSGRPVAKLLGSAVETLKEQEDETWTGSRVLMFQADIEAMLRDALANARRRLESSYLEVPLRTFAYESVSRAQDALARKGQRAVSMKHIDSKTSRQVEQAAMRLQCLLELFWPLLPNDNQRVLERLIAARASLRKLDDVLASVAVVRQVAPSFDETLRWLDKERRIQSRIAVERLAEIPMPG